MSGQSGGNTGGQETWRVCRSAGLHIIASEAWIIYQSVSDQLTEVSKGSSKSVEQSQRAVSERILT